MSGHEALVQSCNMSRSGNVSPGALRLESLWRVGYVEVGSVVVVVVERYLVNIEIEGMFRDLYGSYISNISPASSIIGIQHENLLSTFFVGLCIFKERRSFSKMLSAYVILGSDMEISTVGSSMEKSAAILSHMCAILMCWHNTLSEGRASGDVSNF